MRTECCGVAIANDQRFCPKCGSEARVMLTTVYDNQQRAAQLVRSWRDHFISEGQGLPPLLILGGKCLFAADIFTNIAAAIDAIPRPPVTIADEWKTK